MGSSVSHETYLSHNSDINDGYHYSATFEDDYFDQGNCRYAFRGVLSGDGPRNGKKCVTKVFKGEYAKNLINWAPDLAASKKAYGFANEFMNNYYPRIEKFLGKNEIEFLIPLIAKMKSLKAFEILWLFPVSKDERYVKMYEYVALEPFIEGSYEKFNSNGGYEHDVHQLMTAFCHWTWYISGHRFMVCDLQGVKSYRKYILTDPAIHSYDQRFGDTDLGVEGMERVLGNHKCNMLCRALGLDNPMTGVYVRSGPRSTTYSFQVTEEELLKARRGRSDHFKLMTPIFE